MSLKIDAKQGLTGQEILRSQSMISALKQNGALQVNLSCNLTVKCQLQFGESLYLRGQCDRLAINDSTPRWDKGIALHNKDSDTWTASVCFTEVHKSTEVAFKFLINDEKWEEGENHCLQDLLFLTQKSLSSAEEEFASRHKDSSVKQEGAQENKDSQPNALRPDAFRICPKEQLTPEELLKAQNLTKLLNENPYLSISFADNFIIQKKLQFGESLYLRGEMINKDVPLPLKFSYFYVSIKEPTWNQGIELQNQSSDTWSTRIALCIHKYNQIAFKFLINDQKWEEGENHGLQDLLFIREKNLSLKEESVKKQADINARFERERADINARFERERERIRRENDDIFKNFERECENIFKNSEEAFNSFNHANFNYSSTYSYDGSNFSYSHSSFPSGGSSRYSSPGNSQPRRPNPTSSSQPRYNASSSSNFSSSISEADRIKGELERILGATISDSKSLTLAFNKWSLKNHPDKLPAAQRESATQTFQNAVDLRDKLKQLKHWG